MILLVCRMLFFLSCTTPSSDTASAQQQAIVDHEPWEYGFSIVHEGALIHDGAIIERETAPAGIDQTNTFSFVISPSIFRFVDGRYANGVGYAPTYRS